MRSARPLILFSALLLALAPVSALAKDHVIEEADPPDRAQDPGEVTLPLGHVIEESEEPEFLFVVSAGSGSVEDGTLTLVAVPSVVYFSDRPSRIAGHRSVEDFVAAWGQGEDSFSADPPNAVLSLLAAEGVKDSVIELSSAELDGDALRFGFDVIEGSPPEGAFGPASLFIDSKKKKQQLLEEVSRRGTTTAEGRDNSTPFDLVGGTYRVVGDLADRTGCLPLKDPPGGSSASFVINVAKVESSIVSEWTVWWQVDHSGDSGPVPQGPAHIPSGRYRFEVSVGCIGGPDWKGSLAFDWGAVIVPD